MPVGAGASHIHFSVAKIHKKFLACMKNHKSLGCCHIKKCYIWFTRPNVALLFMRTKYKINVCTLCNSCDCKILGVMNIYSAPILIYEQYFERRFSIGKSPFLNRSASNCNIRSCICCCPL